MSTTVLRSDLNNFFVTLFCYIMPLSWLGIYKHNFVLSESIFFVQKYTTKTMCDFL